MKRKIFLSGLDFSTDEETLENYFSKYGPIADILINKDQKTGKRKGFGFVLFQEESVAHHLVTYSPEHVIDGRVVLCKPCFEKGKIEKQYRAPTFNFNGYKSDGGNLFGFDFPSQAFNFFAPQINYYQQKINPYSQSYSPLRRMSSQDNSYNSQSHSKMLNLVLENTGSIRENHYSDNIAIRQPGSAF